MVEQVSVVLDARVKTAGEEGEGSAAVGEEEVQVWETVKDAGEVQPRDGDGCFEGETGCGG